MAEGWHPLGRLLIVTGLLLVGLGAAVSCSPRLSWLGHLPGDLIIRRDHATVYLPFATCLLLSVLLSAALWLVGRFR